MERVEVQVPVRYRHGEHRAEHELRLPDDDLQRPLCRAEGACGPVPPVCPLVHAPVARAFVAFPLFDVGHAQLSFWGEFWVEGLVSTSLHSPPRGGPDMASD